MGRHQTVLEFYNGEMIIAIIKYINTGQNIVITDNNSDNFTQHDSIALSASSWRAATDADRNVLPVASVDWNRLSNHNTYNVI